MKGSLCTLLLSTFAGVQAICADDGDGRFNSRIANFRAREKEHAHGLQARSQDGTFLPAKQELRSLEWGDLNFVHITDTHGWLSGHADQDQFAADWGDLISFNQHLRAEADRRDVDFLVIETGDRHDGTGLSDATTVDGSISQLAFAQAELDILSIGNHELYTTKVAQQEYNLLRPYYGDHYLASNVEIEIQGKYVPAGHRYRIFETKNRKIRILSFGFIFNFAGYANGTKVTKVEDALKQDWFQQVIRRNDFDIVLVTGHIPIRDFDEYDAIFKAIREVKPHIPIQGFGGHTHLRDYRVFDKNAAALESGRYLETIGWASVKLPITNGTNSTTNHTRFSRRYIDFNPQNFAFHTKTSLNATANETAFQTEKGLAVTQLVAGYRKQLNLDNELATIPQDYWIDRAPYPGNDSLLTLAEEHVFQELQGNVSRNDKPRYIISNSGAFRYDLLHGKYTADEKYIVSPFTNDWYYIRDVPIEIANKVIGHLNNDFKSIKRDAGDVEASLLARIHAPTSTASIPSPAAATHLYIPPPSENTTTPYAGYHSIDDLGDDGDDTPHEGYTFYDIPNAIQAVQNVDDSTETVDVVYLSFLHKNIGPYIAGLGYTTPYSLYGGKQIRDLIEDYFKSE